MGSSIRQAKSPVREELTGIIDTKPFVRTMDTGEYKRILRWSSRYPVWHQENYGTEDLVLLAEAQRLHLGQLAVRSDIRIPTFSSFIGQNVPDDNFGRWPALYNLVHHVPQPEVHQPFNAYQLKMIAKGLLTYYAWVRDSNQAVFLDDLDREEQFAHGPLNGVCLLDIEPAFSAVNTPVVFAGEKLSAVQFAENKAFWLLDEAAARH